MSSDSAAPAPKGGAVGGGGGGCRSNGGGCSGSAAGRGASEGGGGGGGGGDGGMGCTASGTALASASVRWAAVWQPLRALMLQRSYDVRCYSALTPSSHALGTGVRLRLAWLISCFDRREPVQIGAYVALQGNVDPSCAFNPASRSTSSATTLRSQRETLLNSDAFALGFAQRADALKQLSSAMHTCCYGNISPYGTLDGFTLLLSWRILFWSYDSINTCALRVKVRVRVRPVLSRLGSFLRGEKHSSLPFERSVHFGCVSQAFAAAIVRSVARDLQIDCRVLQRAADSVIEHLVAMDAVGDAALRCAQPPHRHLTIARHSWAAPC
eukprot:6191633-Pleurochrysis_carterae.AAC.2